MEPIPLTWRGDRSPLQAVTTTLWQGVDQAYLELRTARNALQAELNSDKRWEALYGLGGLAAVTGNVEEALDYLEQAIAAEQQAVDWARYDIAWQSMRPNPRFQALINPKN